MATGFSRTTDCHDFQDAALPYDVQSKELDDTPRLVAGSNLLGLLNGKLVKRPGFPLYASLPSITGRVDAAVLYKTDEESSKVYILVSVYNGVSWSVQYIRPEVGGSWTSIGTLRNVNASQRAHEMVVHKGKVFIKGYPGASGDKLGSVVWDGSGTPTLRIWGILGPTTAARLTGASSTWPAAAHPVTVRNGWKYAYSWETVDGHLSNRSPQETNPDLQPSDTGNFSGRRPQIVVQGNADTTNIPNIVIWRTTDGGGVWLFLDRITNTGAGNITYEDNKRASGLGNVDPKTDAMLDSANQAPSETSNDPPPPVTDPNVVGTSTVEKSTNIVSMHGRLWFAIRGDLFYSALEEVFNGLPEHCWPSGFGGNVFPTGEYSVAVAKSPGGLLHFTDEHVHIVRGFNRESFAHTPLFLNAGMSREHPRAVAVYTDLVFWVTKDFRVCASVGEQLIVLSEALGDDIRGYITANREVRLAVWARQEKQYLVVLVADKVDSTLSRAWVLDLKTRKWNVPWSVRQVMQVVGRARESVQDDELIGVHYNNSSSAITAMSFTTKRDHLVGTGNTDYGHSFDTALLRVPLGNHMNSRRLPVVVPDVVAFVLHRTKFASDTEPTVSSRMDEFGASPAWTALTAVDPPRRTASTSYNEKWYHTNQAAPRASVRVVKSAANEDFEMQSLALVYRPEMGA